MHNFKYAYSNFAFNGNALMGFKDFCRILTEMPSDFQALRFSVECQKGTRLTHTYNTTPGKHASGR